MTRHTYDFRVVVARAKEDIAWLAFQIAKRELGSPGRIWGERSSYDSTHRLWFADDKGVLPGSGRGRFTTIPQLLSRFKQDMPKRLPKVLQEIEDLFKSGEYSNEHRLENVSFAWKGKSGEDEEWSVPIPEIAAPTPKKVDADPKQLRDWVIKAIKRVGDGVRANKAGTGVKYNANARIDQDSRAVHGAFWIDVENPIGNAANYRPGIFFYWTVSENLGSVTTSGLFMKDKNIKGLEWGEMEGAMMELADAIIEDLKRLMRS